MKPADVLCPFLSFEGAIASCAVHDQPFFAKPNCPCHVYGNSDIDPDFYHRKGKPCIIGKIIQERGGLVTCRPFPQETLASPIEERGKLCEDLGPWPKEEEEEEEEELGNLCVCEGKCPHCGDKLMEVETLRVECPSCLYELSKEEQQLFESNEGDSVNKGNEDD
jgi:hypothetical protein